MAHFSSIFCMLLDSKHFPVTFNTRLNLIQYDGREADLWERLQDWIILEASKREFNNSSWVFSINIKDALHPHHIM
jgi:hypothetical protein